MANLVFLFCCLMFGALLKHFRVLPTNAPSVINNLILYVCLPATSLIYASSIAFDVQYLLAIAMPWVLYGGSVLFFGVLSRYVPMHKHTKAVLIMTSGIPSISFIGLPVFQILYGDEGARIGILMSQAGSFLACSTVGVITASVYAAEQPNYKKILKDVLTFPTFIAFAVAITFNYLDIAFPAFLIELLKKFSIPFTFLALISVGLQMEFNHKALQINNLRWGFLYKLALSPLLIWLLYFVLLRQNDTVARLSVMGAAVGSMNMTGVLALRYGINPTLAAQMIGISIPVSLGLVYLINFLI